MKAWKIRSDAVDAVELIMLSNREFRRKFHACLKGEVNEFSPYIRVDRGRIASHEWKILRADVFARDDYTCQYCGERGGKLECDHVIPIAKGGRDDMENLKTACFACNRSKRDKLLSEWGGR